MFTVYLTNSNNESLALTDDLDAVQVATFESDDIRPMLEYIAQALGTTGYRVNDDFMAEAFIVTGYRVIEDRFDKTDEVADILARRV